MEEFTELIPMGRSRKAPKEGDVFLVQPFPQAYYCGKVIRTQLESKDSCVRGMNLIFLYDKRTDGQTLPHRLDGEELLIPPVIINRLPWSRGYFETVGNAPVTQRERSLSYGFWSFREKRFVDVQGLPLDREPRYWSDYGLAGYALVGEKIQAALKG